MPGTAVQAQMHRIILCLMILCRHLLPIRHIITLSRMLICQTFSMSGFRKDLNKRFLHYSLNL